MKRTSSGGQKTTAAESRAASATIRISAGGVIIAVVLLVIGVRLGALGFVYGAVASAGIALALLGKLFPGQGLFSLRARHAIRHSTGSADPGLIAGTGWQVMCIAFRLMPPAAGSRWLAEAESFLTEAPYELRCGAIRSYLISAPQVIVMAWASDLTRRIRSMIQVAK